MVVPRQLTHTLTSMTPALDPREVDAIYDAARPSRGLGPQRAVTDTGRRRIDDRHDVVVEPFVEPNSGLSATPTEHRDQSDVQRCSRCARCTR